MGLITSVVGKLQTHPVYVKPEKAAYQRQLALEKWKAENPDKTIINGQVVSLATWSPTHSYSYSSFKKDKKEIKSSCKKLKKVSKKLNKININDSEIELLLNDLEKAKKWTSKRRTTEFASKNLGRCDFLIQSFKDIKTPEQYNKFINEQIAALEKSLAKNKKGFSAYLESEEKINHKIEKMNSVLNKQQADLNSGKNVGANDPQKAEKLAKIAKLQRELDSLKSEVSEDFEPEIVDKNN